MKRNIRGLSPRIFFELCCSFKSQHVILMPFSLILKPCSLILVYNNTHSSTKKETLEDSSSPF